MSRDRDSQLQVAAKYSYLSNLRNNSRNCFHNVSVVVVTCPDVTKRATDGGEVIEVMGEDGSCDGYNGQYCNGYMDPGKTYKFVYNYFPNVSRAKPQ